MNKYVGQQRRRFLLFFGLIAAATILATVFAVKRIFLNPLKSIQVGKKAMSFLEPVFYPIALTK